MDGGASGPFSQRFSDAVDRFAAFLEKDRLSILAIFLYVLAISVFRDISEYYLLDSSFVNSSHPWIFSISHHVAFYFVTFMGLVLLLSAFSGRGMRRSLNFVCCIYWVIVLPPYLDHFLFGQNVNYSYFSPTEFVDYILHFSGEAFHPGQAFEIVFILFSLFAYTIWVQRQNLATIEGRVVTTLRVGCLLLFSLLAMFLLATPAAYLPVGSENGVPVFPNFEAMKYYQFHMFIFAYYLVLALALLIAIGYLARRDLFTRLVRRMRPAQTVFFMGIVTAGIVLGWRSAGGMTYVTSILSDPYWINIEFVTVALVAAFMAWQVTALWNDISDIDTDSPNRKDRVLAAGLLNKKIFVNGSAILAICAIFISYLLSFQQALLMAAILLLGYVYTFKPIRLKDHMLSSLLIGLGASLVFLFGFLTPFTEVGSFYIGLLPIQGSLQASITLEAIVLAFFAFIGLVVGSMITDVDGFEEDRRGNIRTIYTVLGLDRGVMIVSVLTFAASFTPLFFFNSIPDLIVFPVLGMAATIAFYRARSSRAVLLIAMIGFAYGAIRYVQILGQ